MVPEENSGRVLGTPHETAPAPPAPGPSPRALESGAGRVRTLKSIRALRDAGLPWLDVAARLEMPYSSVRRLALEFEAVPDSELTPARCSPSFVERGRASQWDALAQEEAVQARLQELYLLTIGASSDYMAAGRRTGSATLALERFADDPLCPRDLASALRRHRFPGCLLQVIRRITADVEARTRGASNQALNGTLIQRRSLIEVLSDGSSRPIAPADWWVFDDMSDNQPFWFIGPDGSPQPGRQGLYAYDVTRKWIGVELIGTSRDSYSAAIVLRFMRRLMQIYGKPRRGAVLEQSVWRARCIAGVKVGSNGELEEEQIQRPEMSVEDRRYIQDGLRAIGIEVHYTYTPRGKEIEGAFNYLQRVLPTFAPGAVNIGRHRGEFEHGARQLRRANDKVAPPAALGFTHIDDRAGVIDQAMRWIDGRIADRELSDQARWDASIAASPLAPLDQLDLAVFLPEIRDLQIRGGKVTATVEGQPFDFCNPEVFAALGPGYRLQIRFDPAEPDLGAAVYNLETGSANHVGYQVGQFIAWASLLPVVPRFNWSDADEDPAGDAKRRYNRWVRTAFRATGLPQHAAGTLRDGRGNVAEVRPGAGGEAAVEPRGTTPAGRQVASLSRAMRPATPAEFAAQAKRFSRLTAAVAALPVDTDTDR